MQVRERPPLPLDARSAFEVRFQGTGPSPADHAARRPPTLAAAAIGGSGHAIRIPPAPATVWCPHCNRSLLAAGPTGYLDDLPLCDVCLLQQAPDLGLLLALMAVARACANVEGSLEERRAALFELGGFVRIYERFAARHGPPRRFESPLGLDRS